MEYWNYTIWTYSILLLSATFIILLFQKWKSSTNNRRLPPGPPGWPLFGNIFDLGSAPHRTLTNLKQKYGPIIWLNLGSVKTMVILSSTVAAEFFKNHDRSFADRVITDTTRSHDFYKGSILLAPYGPYYRMLKRIITVEMFSTKRINDTAQVREKCVNKMLSWLHKEAEAACEVHVAQFVSLGVINVLGNLMLSSDLVDPEAKLGVEFRTAMLSLLEVSGLPNVSDFFPWIRWFDLQGLRRRMDRDMAKVMKIISDYVEQRVRERAMAAGVGESDRKGGRRKDFLNVLLDFEGTAMDEPAKLSMRDIIIFIMEIFVAGSDTTTSTTEWALTELLCNPETMIKVKAELARVIGHSKKFKESDIDNLPYLNSVIKETLRLHQPAPFLVPRKAILDNINFMGYRVPKNTQVLVNAWAIGRDSENWDQPLSFKPERFVDSISNNYKGHHFEMLPFGAGCRICPGIPLAQRMVPLILGSLLHEFDWELGGNVTPETMDMREKMALSMVKLEPLKAIPKKRNTVLY